MTRTALAYDENWFEPDELAHLRRRLPMPYINAVPIHLDDNGEPDSVGLLLRTGEDGTLVREVIGGRVRFHETLRAALLRHAEKDLGPLAFPSMPASLNPFHVAEYFPTEGTSRFHDPRQHAIALCYILPVQGECTPRQDALSLDWLTPEEALRADIVAEMNHGQEHIVKAALAYMGLLP